MRFMILARAAPAESDAAVGLPGSDAGRAAMARYHDELGRAGVLLDAAELIAGYTLIQVRSRGEAMEWARRFPQAVGEGRAAEIEVRQLAETSAETEAGR